MPCFTYGEFEPTKDEYIAELTAEVYRLTDKCFLVHEMHYTRERWFRKAETEIRYSVLFHTHTSEWQVMLSNVPRGVATAFLVGYICGVEQMTRLGAAKETADSAL